MNQTPSAAKTASKEPANLVSRSRINNRTGPSRSVIARNRLHLTRVELDEEQHVQPTQARSSLRTASRKPRTPTPAPAGRRPALVLHVVSAPVPDPDSS